MCGRGYDNQQARYVTRLGEAMKDNISIVDQGRGPQLSTCRVTVQDLVPYFQDGCSYEEIRRWIPVLSAEEIRVVEQYFAEHREEVLELERQIHQRNANRKERPEIEKIRQAGRAKFQALKERLLGDGKNGAAP